jgi:hypothetical protein
VVDAHGDQYQQELWPDHAVVGTNGVEIEKDLRKHLLAWKGEKKLARKVIHPKPLQYSPLINVL